MAKAKAMADTKGGTGRTAGNRTAANEKSGAKASGTKGGGGAAIEGKAKVTAGKAKAPVVTKAKAKGGN